MSEISQLPQASLARIVHDLGLPFLEVVAGDVAPHTRVSAVVVHDARRDAAYPPGAVVLGIGVDGAADISDLLTLLKRMQCAALIVRSPVERTDHLLRCVRGSRVVLIALAEAADWLQLADVLRTVVGQDAVGDEVPSTLGGVPAGDLFALANAIAALIDAPITIEDRGYRVLAFSGLQSESDPARVQTILERQVPEVYIREDEERGVFQAVYESEVPLFVEASNVSENEIPRVAIAVRAGDEILGSIWAAVRDPLSKERSQALADAAKLVALHLLRRRAGADVDHRLRSDLVATALEGGPASTQAVARLGLLGKIVNVVAMDVLTGGSNPIDPSALVSSRQRIADAFAMHLSAVVPRSATALLGDVIYGLIPLTAASAQGEERVKRIAADFLTRTGSRIPAVIGVGSPVDNPSRLHESREKADRALRVLRSRAQPGRVATMTEVHIDALVLELQDLSRTRQDPITGPLSLILDYDQRRHASLMATLTCWLNSFGDIHAAAKAAGVHHNTFRYRLKRVREIGGIDLEDPDQRFAMMLQMRLIRLDSD